MKTPKSVSVVAASLLLLGCILSCGTEVTGIDDGGGGGQDSGGQEVSRVDVTPTTQTILGIGTTQQFLATARDASGNAVSGASISWSSSNTGIATITSAGLATASGIGTATITATSSGISGTASLSVQEAPPQFTGFDFSLVQGYYWDYFWSFEYNTVSGSPAWEGASEPQQQPAANTHTVTGGGISGSPWARRRTSGASPAISS